MMGLCADAIQLARKEKGETEEPGMLPIINYYEESFMKSFVEKFESKEMKRLFEAHDWWLNQNKKEDLIYSDLKLLFKAEETLPIKSNSNWMVAIKEAANQYRLTKIVEALPEAWEHYTLNMQTGISFSFDKTVVDKYEAIKTLHIKQVIAGRLLNDEPGDLNF